MNTSYPLTDVDLQALNYILESAPMILDMLHRMEECGADCQDKIVTVQAQLDMANKIKAKWFPEES